MSILKFNTPTLHYSRILSFCGMKVICFLVCFGLSLTPWTAHAELAIVWKEADLYQNSRISSFLIKEEIVHVKEDQKYNEWFQLLHNGEKYLSRKRNFRTERRVFLELNDEKISIESELEQLNNSLSSNRNRLSELYTGILQLQWDRTIFYQMITPTAKVSRRLNENIVDQDKFRFERIEKVSSAKARRLRRKWTKSIKRLEMQNSDLRRRWRTLNDKLIINRLQSQHLRTRFRDFQRREGTYQITSCIVSGRTAGLYEGTRRIHTLNKGSIVACELDREDPHRLNVEYMGTWYDTPAPFYQPKTRIEELHTREMATITLQVETLQVQIELFERRKNALSAYRHELTYCIHINHEFMLLDRNKDYRFSMLPKESSWLDKPATAREAIHTARAYDTIRKWNKELNRVENDIARHWESIRELKQKQAYKEAAHDALMYRFESVN